METKPKNRAWVKDVAIVFLIVLLLLTFFSNTIMNHSLPEVATSMVSGGSITAKVRGTGTVTANGSHKVKANSGFTIGKVMIKSGQEVNAGDVLFVLGAADSTELEEAMNTLEDLQVQYSQAALSVPLAESFVSEKNAVEEAERARNKAKQAWEDAKAEYTQAGSSEKVKELLDEKQTVEENINIANQQLSAQQLVLTAVNGEVSTAQSEYNRLYDQWKSEVTITPAPETTPTAEPTPTPATPDGDSGASGEKNVQNAKNGEGESETSQTVAETPETQSVLETAAENVLARPFATVGALTTTITLPAELNEAPQEVKDAYVAWQTLVNKENEKKNERVPALLGVDGTQLQKEDNRLSYITSLQYTVNTLSAKLKAIEAQLKTYGLDSSGVDALWESYLKAEADYNAKVDALYRAAAQQDRSIASASTGLTAISNQIKRQQEKIKKLSGEGDSNTITANVGGTITEVNVSAGDTVIKDDILAVIEVADQGYTVSFSVTNDQAKRLRVGDSATISNYYWGNKVVATLATIQTDKKNPTTNKLLTFDLEGDVTSGSELTVSVGQKSASYDTIIPNSSIRTDSNGSFVLAVVAKNSPLGNRYIAKRVAIEVIAADDTNSAVTAELNNGDYVITTSSAPVANGDMVRLANAEN